MSNYSVLHSPDQIGDAFPVAYAELLAGGTGDNTEVTSEAISVLGTNAGSASAHGVVGTRYEALEARFLIVATLADTKSLVISNLMPQHADPDSSGDPDTFVDVTPVEDIEVDIIRIGATPKQDDRTAVSVTTNVRDDITVHTADGAVTAGLFMVRVKIRVQFPARATAPLNLASKEFLRVQFTPDLDASGTDTARVFLELVGLGGTRAYESVD